MKLAASVLTFAGCATCACTPGATQTAMASSPGRAADTVRASFIPASLTGLMRCPVDSHGNSTMVVNTVVRIAIPKDLSTITTKGNPNVKFGPRSNTADRFAFDSSDSKVPIITPGMPDYTEFNTNPFHFTTKSNTHEPSDTYLEVHVFLRDSKMTFKKEDLKSPRRSILGIAYEYGQSYGDWLCQNKDPITRPSGLFGLSSMTFFIKLGLPAADVRRSIS